ncbi:MAG TPA: F0F1 ATP synthase subunit A [Acidimicrobiia bacterium]|nr:F0F1 ATP synthase subunit A [Acidimicrobiia bacterium]
MDVILAFTCEPAEQPLCIPESVTELFELPVLFGQVNRTMLYILLAAFVVIGLLYATYRKPRLVPTKFGVAMESLVDFVRNDIAIGVIGPGGEKYAPYLLALFLFILVGNFFGITPFIMFPLGSRMAIPAFLALVTYFIFVIVGFKKQGLAYLGHTLWPPGVPTALKPLIGLIELVSIFVVRPFSLAVRLFANLVAGHTMLALLLGSGVFFIYAGATGMISPLKAFLVGPLWFIFGMAIFTLELLVLALQAYIFTLLSAVYIESSLHPAH